MEGVEGRIVLSIRAMSGNETVRQRTVVRPIGLASSLFYC